MTDAIALSIQQIQLDFKAEVCRNGRAKCWLAQFDPAVLPKCDGFRRACHLIDKQNLKRELRRPLLEEVDGNPRILDMRLATIIYDPRSSVCGCDKHHHMLDVSKTLRIPRESLPAAVEEFAAELTEKYPYNFKAWLDRRYGERI